MIITVPEKKLTRKEKKWYTCFYLDEIDSAKELKAKAKKKGKKTAKYDTWVRKCREQLKLLGYKK